MKKRLLSLLLALVTVFSLAVPAYAEAGEPVDVPVITEAAEPEAPAAEPEEPAELETPVEEPEEFIEVIAINAPTELTEAEEEKPGDEIVFLSVDEPQTMAAVKNGLVKDADGVMRYYANGQVDTSKKGVAQLADKSSGNWYYVEKGVFAKKTGIAQKADGSSSAWYYVKNGVYTKATGIAQKADGSSSAWYYIKNGVYTKDTGIAQKADGSSSAWYYVQNGVYTKATGIAQKADKSSTTWYYVQNGSYLKTYTGLAPRISDGKLFYVRNGAYLKTFNGNVTYNGKTYTVKNGAAVDGANLATPKITNVSTSTVTAYDGQADAITIKWGAVSGAAKYRVFYKVGSSGWKKLADTANTSYTTIYIGDDYPISDSVYTFTVRCLSADGKSYTSEYDAVGKSLHYIDAPDFKEIYSEEKGVRLTWDTVPGASKYRLFYKAGSGSWTKIADVTPAVSDRYEECSYLWTGAKEGTTYSFTIRCLSADGKSYISSFFEWDYNFIYLPIGDIQWSLKNGVLTISGKGAMDSSNYSYGWDSYAEEIKSVVIENGVTSIGPIAFLGFWNLTSVTLPNSVISIGDYAFCSCPSLSELTIPASVTSIGDGAFAQCYMLTLSVASGNKSFTVVDGVLFNAAKTELIQYPGGKTGSSYTIPSGVTEVRSDAFMGASLTSITLPASLINWNNSGYIPLTAINVSSGNKNYASVDGVLFNAAKTELILYPAGNKNSSYTIPGTVNSIGDSAFLCSDYLESVTIPKSVTEIGYGAFDGCPDLVISGYKGSAAQTYANENGITFKAIG